MKITKYGTVIIKGLENKKSYIQVEHFHFESGKRKSKVSQAYKLAIAWAIKELQKCIKE